MSELEAYARARAAYENAATEARDMADLITKIGEALGRTHSAIRLPQDAAAEGAKKDSYYDITLDPTAWPDAASVVAAWAKRDAAQKAMLAAHRAIPVEFRGAAENPSSAGPRKKPLR